MQSRREKIFNIPFVVVALVALLVGIHGLRELLSAEQNVALLINFAFVPGRFTFAFDPDSVARVLDAARSAGTAQVEVDRLFLGDGRPLWWTPVTYALLHASWAHVGLNCLWLIPFGAAVARRFGNLRFVLFCFATALAGALVHFLTHIDDLQPVIGASAIVSGTMGAALRFVFQVNAPLGLGFADPQNLAYRQPALPLRAVFTNRTALVFLIFWFIANLLFGIGAGSLGVADATVAWQAHIGGFLLGLLGFPLFDPPPAQGPPASHA
ncbi:MAG: rhomboid family intramembrane serine protease [Methylovirgula sp.]